ncbi:MAG TPA: 3-isopropylmalate dehydratase large subunit [Gammaproteobacteria bacterium]|nr:3-isopropylmalate dehydratase large subunit [Gammaproteobacteria bacterium]
MAGRTLYDKLWDAHVVDVAPDGTTLLYIDRHFLHEVSSPQAFEAIALAGRTAAHPEASIAVADHNVPTRDRGHVADPISRRQIEALDENCRRWGILEFGLADRRQGIVHVVGPEQGLTLPGMTIVCGDSHTSTHGALGTLAFGIGTSEIEHVLATQCLRTHRSRRLLVQFEGSPRRGVYPKDLVLAMIGYIGTAGATGHAIEYAGPAIEGMSPEGRMTVCNMSIEAGARCGLVGVDQHTIDYLRGRPFTPKGELWDRAVRQWRDLRSDPDAAFDRRVSLDAAAIRPQVTWGTSPGMVASVDQRIPDPEDEPDPVRRQGMYQALTYMDLRPGQALADIPLDRIFIGSCTNARIEDLRAAAAVVQGRRLAAGIRQALVVPGSGLVRRQAESEGLDGVFREAGFEWREPGCSMCLGMNEDRLDPGERCASTSNRNFEGRQGPGGRTHLASPAMVAAAAIHGHFVDISSAGPTA